MKIKVQYDHLFFKKNNICENTLRASQETFKDNGSGCTHYFLLYKDPRLSTNIF